MQTKEKNLRWLYVLFIFFVGFKGHIECNAEIEMICIEMFQHEDTCAKSALRESTNCCPIFNEYDYVIIF